ncbi:MAG: NUDIX domain-containing protein [Candidatus Bilamarchaeaceae archaeon]
MKLQELNVYLVLLNKERILVLKRKDGFWEFPGGGVDWGEDPEESALRETFEETSITVKKPLKLLGVTSATYQKGADEKHSIYLVYLGRTEQDNVSLSEEHIEYRWLTKRELAYISLGLNAEPVLDMIEKEIV